MFIYILCPLLIWVVFFLLNCKSCLYMLDTSYLSDTWFVNIFSPPICCIFILLVEFPNTYKLLILRKSSWSTFSFALTLLISDESSLCLILGQKDLLLYFFLRVIFFVSKSFVLQALTLRSVIHFKLLLVNIERLNSNFTLLPENV